jgi:hypothetical protein
VNVPAVLRVRENDWPGCKHPPVWAAPHDGLESNVPPSAVALCGAASLLANDTVVPAATVSVCGWYAKFTIETPDGAA